MLKRAHIIGYKSLRDAEIVFADPLSLILGPNAAGKTNLLDALSLLSRIMKVRSIKEAFEQEHRGSYLEAFSLDESGIAGLMAHPEREMRFEIDVELSPHTIQPLLKELHTLNAIDPSQIRMETPLRYTLHIQTRDQGRELVLQPHL
jgi:AAA15 family ATPase/GTPase